MLVTHQEADFFKKATGKITFLCNDGIEIKNAVQKTIETGEGQTIKLISEGYNEEGTKVSSFLYIWSIRIKK